VTASDHLELVRAVKADAPVAPMTRRVGLMAMFAIIGQLFHDDAEARQSLTTLRQWPPPPSDLTVRLGGPHGYQRFIVTDGTETVTFTAQDLMDALKGP
jgi:hypothetical protein